MWLGFKIDVWFQGHCHFASFLLSPLSSSAQRQELIPIPVTCQIWNSFIKVCKSWDIPFLSLDGVEPGEIPQLVESMDPKPRVLLCTISTVSSEKVQEQIRRLPVKTICLDEVQVFIDRVLYQGGNWDLVHYRPQYFFTIILTMFITSKVVNSDEKIGWGGFLPYW